MQIIPAIDLREGACARLLGDKQAESDIYSDDLLEQVSIFKQLGAEQVHITDLDGAFSGHICNLRILQEVVRYTDMSVQLSGGIRSMENIDTVLSIGISRVVLGAAILRNNELTARAIQEYGTKVVAGIDARDGMVTIEGFETSASKTVKMLLDEIIPVGMKDIIYTDVRRYGSMKGPNLEGIEDVIKRSGVNIFIAGGVSDYQTITDLKNIGAAGIVIGKALYTGAIDFVKAKEIAAL
ncbi:MAG: HisA/HisF-related TIM barrel protein [Clostridiales bacterium]